MTHICQLCRGKLGNSSTSTESARILLPLLLLLLGKLEKIGGSSLLDGLLSRGWVGGRLLGLGLGSLLRLGLGSLLGRWGWG